MAMLIALTELDAVNLMLEAIGEQPVNTITNTGISEVELATQVLLNTSRNLQVQGWSFNNETNYTLLLNSENKLLLPPNVLKVFPMDASLEIVQRGNKLYDKTNHTYDFTSDLKVDITFFLPFEELPQSARTYIYVLAARDFQKKILGADSLVSLTESDEFSARTAFLQEEDDVGQYNIFQSYSVARPINRNQNPYPVGGR